MERDLLIGFFKSENWNNFVNTSTSSSTSTGDSVLLFIILAAIMFVAASIFVIVKQRKFCANKSISSKYISNKSIFNAKKLFFSKFFVISFSLFVALIISLFLFIGQKNAFAHAPNDIDVNFSNEVKCLVNNDGSVYFTDTYLKNDETNKVRISNICLEELESTNNAIWTIKDADSQDVIFEGKSGDKKDLKLEIDAKSNKHLSFSASIDKEIAKSLVDKNVLKCKLSFNAIRNIKLLNVDGTSAGNDISDWTGGTINVPSSSTPPPGSSGWKFKNWCDVDGNEIDLTKSFSDDMIMYAHYEDPEVRIYDKSEYDLSTFMIKGKTDRSQQGFEIWGDYIFSFEDRGKCNVYNFKDGSRDPQTATDPIGSFNLESSQKENHVNNVEFARDVLPGDDFPLLYISNGNVGSSLEWICFVERISLKDGVFSSKIVQKITLEKSGWKENNYIPIFGAPSWLIDKADNSLWCFSALRRTTHKFTTYGWQNEYIATKFDMPSLDNDDVILRPSDIKKQVIFPFETWFTQAGCMSNGLIYYCYGVAGSDPERPQRIRIYDTNTGKIVGGYNLEDQVKMEPEDIVVRDNWLYLNNNSTKDQGDPRIYKIEIPK